jgi:hypothetical protein
MPIVFSFGVAGDSAKSVGGTAAVRAVAAALCKKVLRSMFIMMTPV